METMQQEPCVIEGIHPKSTGGINMFQNERLKMLFREADEYIEKAKKLEEKMCQQRKEIDMKFMQVSKFCREYKLKCAVGRTSTSKKDSCFSTVPLKHALAVPNKSKGLEEKFCSMDKVTNNLKKERPRITLEKGPNTDIKMKREYKLKSSFGKTSASKKDSCNSTVPLKHALAVPNKSKCLEEKFCSTDKVTNILKEGPQITLEEGQNADIKMKREYKLKSSFGKTSASKKDSCNSTVPLKHSLTVPNKSKCLEEKFCSTDKVTSILKEGPQITLEEGQNADIKMKREQKSTVERHALPVPNKYNCPKEKFCFTDKVTISLNKEKLQITLEEGQNCDIKIKREYNQKSTVERTPAYKKDSCYSTVPLNHALAVPNKCKCAKENFCFMDKVTNSLNKEKLRITLEEGQNIDIKIKRSGMTVSCPAGTVLPDFRSSVEECDIKKPLPI